MKNRETNTPTTTRPHLPTQYLHPQLCNSYSHLDNSQPFLDQRNHNFYFLPTNVILVLGTVPVYQSNLVLAEEKKYLVCQFSCSHPTYKYFLFNQEIPCFCTNHFDSQAIHEGQLGLQRGLSYRLSGKLSPAPRCEREPHNRSLRQLGQAPRTTCTSCTNCINCTSCTTWAAWSKG